MGDIEPWYMDQNHMGLFSGDIWHILDLSLKSGGFLGTLAGFEHPKWGIPWDYPYFSGKCQREKPGCHDHQPSNLDAPMGFHGHQGLEDAHRGSSENPESRTFCVAVVLASSSPWPSTTASSARCHRVLKKSDGDFTGVGLLRFSRNDGRQFASQVPPTLWKFVA